MDRHKLVVMTGNWLLNLSVLLMKLFRDSKQLNLNSGSSCERYLIFTKRYLYTGQSISSFRKVPIEILRGMRHITWVLTVLLFSAEFQMEPMAPNAISYDTRPTTY